MVAWSALKIGAIKAGRLEGGGSCRVGSMGNQQEEERIEEVEDSGLLYETIHAPPLSPDGQQTHIATCDST